MVRVGERWHRTRGRGCNRSTATASWSSRNPEGAAGAVADAAVTRRPGAVLSVQVADCAPVLMFSAVCDGVVLGAAHAGWRGLLGGVLDSTVDAMGRLGAERIDWLLGPCISAANYEFSASDLAALTDSFGSAVGVDTADGAPALDLRGAVRSAMTRAGCGDPLIESGNCTTSATHWSHRRSGDAERQVGAIWWVRC
ncbi:MAG: polyphenol oxidase family protein [Microthrixaceae bacterium]|nr:polyphenol oxidase family protein [Microthrixaceae bacterium]